MPTFRSFDELSRAVNKMARDVEVQNAKTIIKVAATAQQLATQAASADLGGDPKFSGWAPILDTKTRPVGLGRMLLTPTRSSAGPWKVAEEGRNRGHQGFAGPGINRRTGNTSRTKAGGLRQTRTFGKAKRWNGVTPAFHTATEAKHRIELMFPKVVHPLFVRSVRKTFDVR